MENKAEQKELILNGDLKKIVWKLSLPAMGAMVLMGLNTFLDSVFVGQLVGEEALSGVALAYPLTAIILGVGYWIGQGAANLLSITLGKEDEEGQKNILPAVHVWSLLLSLSFAIPLYFLAEHLIGWMGSSGVVQEIGASYYRITLLGAVFWVHGLALNFIIRGEGKMKNSAAMIAIGLMVNIILNPIFIVYFKMGADGAAWATNLGMITFNVVGYLYFLKGKASFKCQLHSLKFPKSVGNQILTLGFPALIVNLMSLVQAYVVFNAIADVGTEKDLAFYAASNRIYLFLMTPLYGLMRGLQPVIGINYGAGKIERVIKGFWLFCNYGMLIVIPFWILITLLPEGILYLILPDMVLSEEQLFQFRIYFSVLPFLPLVFMALTLFPGINKSKYATMIALVRQLVFYVPVMLVFPLWIGMNGVYYGSTMVNMIIVLWTLILVKQEMKKLTVAEVQIQTIEAN